MKLQLDDLALFVRVVELGSLSAAAREADVPVSQVSRAVGRLEKGCRARLLHRSTHGLSPTFEGELFVSHARRMLQTAAELQGALSRGSGGPSGWVRMGVSAVLAQAVVAPSLVSLYERHPRLHVDIAADDRIADLARDGIDVAVRTGKPTSESIVARQIGQLSRSLYAAPAYVASFGMPASPTDLAQHRLLANTASPGLNRWVYGPTSTEFVVSGHTRTNNTAVVLALAVNGVGIGRLIDLVARPLVHSGMLVPILPGEFSAKPVEMYAVMLQERHRLPKIRACIDHLSGWLSEQATA